jgi:hypothetical protein
MGFLPDVEKELCQTLVLPWQDKDKCWPSQPVLRSHFLNELVSLLQKKKRQETEKK